MVARQPAAGHGWFIPLVFVPLVFYALGATFFVAWSILKVQEAQRQDSTNPFDRLPDDGDDRGVTRDGKRISQRLRYSSDFVTQPLPAPQRLSLGETCRFGSLEVTPLRIERKRVSVYVLGSDRPQPCRFDSLVLKLRLTNVSTDEAFAPLDNYFDRWWQPGHGPMPLTFLEAGGLRLCGPAQWAPPRSRRGGIENPQWIEGRKRVDPEGLKPGQQTESFVSTDGNDPQAVRVLFGENAEGLRVAQPCAGPFLWRVQMRRGLIRWRDHDRSATTVIGVEFDRSTFDRGTG